METHVDDEKTHLINVLTQQEKTNLEKHRHLVWFRSNEIIFKQDSPVTHVLFLNKGLAKAHIESRGNKNLILKIAMPVEIFAELDLSGNVYHQYSLSAIENSAICFIDKNHFANALFRNQNFLKSFLSAVQINQENIFSKLKSLNNKCAKGRIAESILYLSEKIYSSDDFTLNISKLNLSELAGVSRESTFKILTEFEKDLLIFVNGSNIKILNKSMLRLVSENG